MFIDHQAGIEYFVCLFSPFSFFSLAVTVSLTFLFKMATLWKSGSFWLEQFLMLNGLKLHIDFIFHFPHCEEKRLFLLLFCFVFLFFGVFFWFF